MPERNLEVKTWATYSVFFQLDERTNVDFCTVEAVSCCFVSGTAVRRLQHPATRSVSSISPEVGTVKWVGCLNVCRFYCAAPISISKLPASYVSTHNRRFYGIDGFQSVYRSLVYATEATAPICQYCHFHDLRFIKDLCAPDRLSTAKSHNKSNETHPLLLRPRHHCATFSSRSEDCPELLLSKLLYAQRQPRRTK